MHKYEDEVNQSIVLWSGRGFSPEESIAIVDYFENRYGSGTRKTLNDRRIHAATHGYSYELDSDVRALGFASRLEMSLAILRGQRDDLLCRSE